MVNTSDFPQADRLEQVGQVVLAIAAGHQSYNDIETYIGLHSEGRQGRYYRLAAEVLGLISNQQNVAVLTDLGREYAVLKNAAARKDFLSRCLIDTPVFREALNYIHLYKPTDAQLKIWFNNFYPGAQSTANRRFVTFMNYLQYSGLLKHSNGYNLLLKYTGSVVKRAIPANHGLTGHQWKQLPPAMQAKEIMSIDVDMQKKDRANQTHWKLVDAKATFLVNRKAVPRGNQHIDLFADIQGDIILYEMKSVDPKGNNLIAQVRRAISQLYEYRYIYKTQKARLCVVTNRAMPKSNYWLLDYLEKDRSIAYEWTCDFTNFECRKSSKVLLDQFKP